ncbi:DUF2125 domain-containing protein [Lutimaribacter sp. EGI FJ00015]|uniref:DUF2125 domain-containing protein n=1 Tax=Lutimaribacter degradans TaxID=2945989 RepID=A0ACC5ZXK4_9RHOB|nr:DUF2125 domain-containing protein [Lutimaribacter sp. EGI FJ00013]MCM2562653.1 DUF2125 domain-containing protein [Lutimaribacter sp. EGI FJ00013]MCO0613810.1 DUF2125 domain-containing protein [Lutimaribacter sp. EGI FJ00015]MCO0636707.1 DUF2125 domain-containing protein [Lutimaribacter sp. EGI FJ00014]
MKRLLFVIVIGALAWAGYWWAGATGTRTGYAVWFDARRAEGWVAEASEIAVRGFPNRFDTTLSDIRLADPETGWAWEAPFLQVFALSYRPNHVIATWPGQHLLATPTQKYEITNSEMQASVVLGAEGLLPLNRANLVADTLAITDEGGNTTAMTSLRLAVERVAETEATYQLGWAADNLAPARATRLRIDTGGQLPQTLSAFRADIEATFTRPWDRRALEQTRPQPTQVTVRLAKARWGDLELALAGRLDIDDQGRPSGRIDVKARNWREILHLARASGQIPDVLADQIETGLATLAQLSGNRQTLDVPLDFRGGRVFLGPVPIGRAPIIRLR